MQIAQSGVIEHGITKGVVRAASLEEHRAVSAELWDIELEPLARGPFSSRTVFLTTPRMAIYHESWNRPLRVRGALRSRQVVFALPTRHGLPFHMAGREARPGMIPWLPDSRRCDVVSEASYENVLVVFDAEFLQGIAAKLQHPAADAAFMAAAPYMLEARPDKAVALRQYIEQLLTGSTASKIYGARLDAQVAEALLDTVAIGNAARSSAGESGSFRRSYPMAAACMEFARSRNFDVSIAELCGLIGRSRRTLEYAFREVTGTTPARYLKSNRLRQVRQALIATRPEESTVSDLAAQWGFFELGRFAGDYRRLFGELPSESLRGSVPTTVSIPGLAATREGTSPAPTP